MGFYTYLLLLTYSIDKIMKSKIALSGMEFYAYHGCFAEEKIIGTRFKVDVCLHCDVTEAAILDDLSKTVNYQQVHSIVAEVMKESVNTLEALAYKIIKKLKENFQIIEKAEVTVYKMNPAIGGKTAWASVSMES